MAAKIVQMVIVDKCEYLLEYYLFSDGRVLIWKRDIESQKGKDVVCEPVPVSSFTKGGAYIKIRTTQRRRKAK